MKIYKYENYEDYVAAQTEANVRKISNVWVRRSTIEKIHSIQPFASYILCHGTRNAKEQRLFRELYPTAEILGTEISSTAEQFPMTVQHDFHEPLKGSWDIVYSNSFDHSYDPEKALRNWKSQLSADGALYLDYSFSEVDNRARRSDPLQISTEELIELSIKVGLTITDEYLTERKESKLYRFIK